MAGGRFLPPWALQVLGILLLVGSAIFWAITGRESLTLMSIAMALIGVGSYEAAFRALLNRRLDEERDRLRSKQSLPAPAPTASEQPEEA